jgi:translation elongation factor P/translation initiation factor 5A
MIILSIIERITKRFALSNGSELEQYITSHEPKCEADIERLTNQYLYRKNRSFTF